MKHLKVSLLALGAVLLIASAPVPASAAGRTACDLTEILKCGTKVTCTVNPRFDTIMKKWCSGNENCKSVFSIVFGNCNRKPETEKPADKEQPNDPGTSVKPENPVKPEKPVKPEQPEKPGQEQDKNQDQNAGESQLGDYEAQVAALVNKERAAAGLPALTVNAKLSQVAAKKAMDMRDKNYFSHTSPTYGSPFDMMKQFGITYRSAGENIAKGQKTPQSVMNGWMNSQGHKANILSEKYTEIGVGYVTDSKGNTYWVQMFIRP